MPSNRNDPFGAFNFIVDIKGVARVGFSEVSGLDLEVEVIEYRSGDDKPLTVRKLPGLIKYSNIVLRRGFTQDRSLWDWIKKVVDGNVQRADVTITLLDDQRQPTAKWVVHQAWPCKYDGPVLNAKSNEVAIESLEICHEGVELAP